MRTQGLFNRLFHPLKKRWQVVLICLLISVVITSRYLYVATPMYQATSTLKIQDSQASMNNNFSMAGNKPAGNIQTEIEVVKSRSLFEKALSQLDFNVEYFHNDELKTEEVYHTAPFNVAYEIKDASFYSQTFDFHYLGGDRFKLVYTGADFNNEKEGKFGVPICDRGLCITLNKNEKIVKKKSPEYLQEPWQFTVNSNAALCNKMMNKNFIVEAINNDVNILKINYSHPIPEKASKMVNAIAAVYINQGIEDRQVVAGTNVDFLNKQLVIVGGELESARDAIKSYREKNQIVNIPQQTESTYKTLGDLEVQKVELNMQLATLEQMSDYLRKNKKINVTASEYGATADGLFADAVTKLNNKYQERDNLKKNTASSDQTAGVDAEILQLKTFLIESINNTRRKLLAKQDELIASIGNEKSSFKGLPE